MNYMYTWNQTACLTIYMLRLNSVAHFRPNYTARHGTTVVLLCAVLQMWWRLNHVAQGALQRS